MIELIFVIVVLGIFAAIAIPKFAVTRNDAVVTKGRADVATIRSAIVSERQTQIIKGVSSWIPKLSDNTSTLFTGDGTRTLLMYGIKAGTTSGHWSGTDPNYKYYVGSSANDFTYDSSKGTFNCTSGTECSQLVD